LPSDDPQTEPAPKTKPSGLGSGMLITTRPVGSTRVKRSGKPPLLERPSSHNDRAPNAGKQQFL
jgi:hypothetical protein